MKIVVTGTRGIPNILGGVETHCEELMPRIVSKGENVTVIRRAAYAKDGFKQWKGVGLVDIDSPKKKAFEAIVHTMRAVNYAAKVKADILHVNAVGPALVAPYAKLRGLKVVFTHHGPDYDRDKWGRVAKGMLRLGEKLGCRYADAVIVISEVIKNSIAEKYGRTQGVHLIPNGVPAPDICDFSEYFTELGITDGRYILGMSRFVPEKRMEDIIDAYQRSNLAADGYKLVLAGDTDFEDAYSKALKARASANGVVLTGFVKGRKLHSLLTHAALYVLASSHEGLPIALLEAMSYGLPVVVSDIPANLEVGLEKDNYFHLGDVDALSVKMVQMVSKDKQKYNMLRYDWDNIAAQTLEVYRSL